MGNEQSSEDAGGQSGEATGDDAAPQTSDAGRAAISALKDRQAALQRIEDTAKQAGQSPNSAPPR